MKKICLLLLPALVLAAPAFAQMEAGMSMMTVGVGAGYALPLGDFANSAVAGGLTLGLNGCYMLTEMYGVEVGVDYAKFPANDDFKDAMKALGVGTDFNMQVIPVTVDFMAAFPVGNMKPYVKGGVGYYFWKWVGDDVADMVAKDSTTASGNDFGMSAGGGVKIPFGETMMFDVGLTYHYVMTEADKMEDGPPYNVQFLAFKAGIEMKF
jgi:opacity protein-like surface antigen